MRTIPISGTIGLDIVPNDLRSQLDEANGEEVRIEVGSPGGFVVPGLEMFNLIKNYPGKVTTHLMGMAASMASYIVLAGDRITAEDNAIFMIHNAWGLAIGDHRDLRKAADQSESMTLIIAKAYARKTGKSLEEVRAMMDADTYLYGEEMAEHGFVDEVLPAGDGAESREEAVALAEMKFKDSLDSMRATSEGENSEKLAALITEMKGAVSPQKPVVNREEKAAATAEKQEDHKMTNLDELKNEAPGLYAEAVAIGEEQGIKKERDRRNAIQAIAAADSGNNDLMAVCEEAIEAGTDQNSPAFMTKVNVAIRDASSLDGENAPNLRTVVTETSALSAEEKSICKNLDISEEEYLANKEAE